MPRTNWTPEQDAKIVSFVRECLTYAQMSERLGKTAESIRTRYLRHIRPHHNGPIHPLNGRPPRQPWTAEESREASRLRKGGWSFRKIAIKLGRHMSNVQAHIRKQQEPEVVAMMAQRREVTVRDRMRIQQELEGMVVPPTQAEMRALRERDLRRQLEPRDLTATLCGDPLPGYSALERRNSS